MIEKIKENWLILLFLLLLIVFISLRISLYFNQNNAGQANQTDLITAEISPTNEPETFEVDPDRDDILEEMPVLTFDISEFVPYETDQFKITSLDGKTNKLLVSAKVDTETAKKSFNDFLKQYISEDSQKTFEVIWQ